MGFLSRGKRPPPSSGGVRLRRFPRCVFYTFGRFIYKYLNAADRVNGRVKIFFPGGIPATLSWASSSTTARSCVRAAARVTHRADLVCPYRADRVPP